MALSRYVADLIQEHLRAIPDDPEAWLFPAVRDSSRPVERVAIGRRLLKAYEAAGLQQPEGGLWHAWRRKWATERKGMSLKDVAAAGGWKDLRTLLECYQQPDEETLLDVTLKAPKLGSNGLEREEATPFPTPIRLVQ